MTNYDDTQDDMINKFVDFIHSRGLDSIAVIFLESSKPINFISGEFGRFFISPFLIALGEDYSLKGEKFFEFISDRNNIEKIILLLEEKNKKKKSEN